MAFQIDATPICLLLPFNVETHEAKEFQCGQAGVGGQAGDAFDPGAVFQMLVEQGSNTHPGGVRVHLNHIDVVGNALGKPHQFIIPLRHHGFPFTQQ